MKIFSKNNRVINTHGRAPVRVKRTTGLNPNGQPRTTAPRVTNSFQRQPVADPPPGTYGQ